MAEQAYAYVTLIPVAKGFQGALAKELGGVEKLGSKSGKDFSKGFSKQADKLSTGIIASFAAVAAGAVYYSRAPSVKHQTLKNP